MTPEEICGILKKEFAEAVLDIHLEGGRPFAKVAVEHWPKFARFLRDDPRLRLNMLRCVSAVDLLAENKLCCEYDLIHVPVDEPESLKTRTWLIGIRVETDRMQPVIPTVSDVWPAADWHEREAYDLMGIAFPGHPDLRRILCPDDWVGHPLRKDYEFPLEYHDIPATTEFELTNPRH